MHHARTLPPLWAAKERSDGAVQSGGPAGGGAAIAALRRLRMTVAEIAGCLEMPTSTVSAVLRRVGLGRCSLDPVEPANRYERRQPGKPVHIDVKKLGRIIKAGAPPDRRPAWPGQGQGRLGVRPRLRR